MRPWLRVARMAAVLWMAVQAPWVAAQSIVHDVEPNNTPDTFQSVAGEVRIMGKMAEQDQDGFVWTVDDVRSLQPWTFTLQGIPGALTVVDVLQLQYAEDGKALTQARKLFTLGSRDGSRPVVLSDLLFEPGEYVLGFARAGGGGSRPLLGAGAFQQAGGAWGAQAASPDSGAPSDAASSAADILPQAPHADDQPMPANGYRLDISAGSAWSPSKLPEADLPRAKAPGIRLNERLARVAHAAQTWYRFSLDDKSARQRWDLLFGTTVGRSVKISLQDREGAPLASMHTDNKGQARLLDLSLPQGEYFLLLEGQEGVLQTIALNAAGQKVEGDEAEPNNDWKTANRVDLFQGVGGSLQVDRDVDVYRFTLDAQQTDQRLALMLETEADSAFRVCLLDVSGRNILCRDAKHAWRLGGLALEAGEYGVKVEGGVTGMRYRLVLQGDGKHNASQESEPNESTAWANSIMLGKRIRGSFDSKGDVDYYRIEADEKSQMWRFQANGDGLHELAYHDGHGRRLQQVRAAAGQKRLILDNLYLAPGTHYVSISGREMGDYVLLSRAQGMADPNAETEPNDTAAHMLPLQVGQARTGSFHDAGDKDIYYFALAAHDHVRLDFQAPLEADVEMRASLAWEGVPLNALSLSSRQEGGFEGVYPPGSYVLTLETNRATEDQYRVGLRRLPRHACAIDCEPNHNAAFSNPLPLDGRIVGRADPVARGDRDWYALPIRDQDTTWHFSTASTAGLDLHLNQQEKAQRLKRGSTEQPYQGVVPANTQGYLIVHPKDAYAIQALPDGQEMAAASPADLSGLSLSLDLPVRQVAAHARLGQRLEGFVVLRNAGAQSLSLALDVVASDLRWQIALPEPAVTVPAGESRAVPVQLRVPDDARAVPVQISARAAHESGSFAHADVQVDVLAESPLAQAQRHWTVPEALRGGLNLASGALGAKVMAAAASGLYRHEAHLIDGTASPARGFEFRQKKLPYDASVTVALAGDGDLPIVGVALHPVSHLGMRYAPQRFSVALSGDGTAFDTVLQGTLEPVRREQYFVLPQPRAARFARLTIHQTYHGDWGGNTALGEWQVIAEPGVSLSDDAINLADRRYGGHVAHAVPSGRRDWPWIDPDAKTFRGGGVVDVRANRQSEWVLGFHHNRAARIDRIVWGKARGDKKHVIEAVDVQVSLHGAVGPWTSVGQLQPDPDEDVAWQLPEPVWARYVRFVLLPVVEYDRQLAMPTAVRVYETPMDGQYRSMLGLWGEDTRGVYEALHPAQTPPALDPHAPHVQRTAPRMLPPGGEASGQVQLGQQEHWYQVRLPDDSNQLALHLSDSFYLKAALAVETVAGEPVPLTAVQEEGNRRHWRASAVPGSTLMVKVFEPPRNVIFAWDTSGSVAAFHDQIYNAMREYARGLQPGRDMVNLLPFDGRLQLQDWQGDPYLAMQAINAHQGTNSSSAESTLITASQALAKRSGSRAVVLITDAATPENNGVWPALAQGQPQIMAVALGSQGNMAPDPELEKRLMLNWSRVNGGHYAFAHDINDMAQAFERTAVLLRQPAAYRLQVASSYVAPPPDGALRIVSAQAPTASGSRPGPATAIILDASGSMLQRLDGERRIEIAKRGLSQAIAGQIAPGTPVSLRVFGHKAPGSCHSDLEIPLQELDVSTAMAAIGKIQAKNLARTPIAESLAMVRRDLAEAKGPRTIVLVTDGEETCDGDPEAVIRELAGEGYDMRLNIIGFALEDPVLEQTFGEWARLGGGEYFSATDKQGFDQAVSKALQVRYTVVDAGGNAVAQGLVDGDPVILPPGDYQVRVGRVPEVVLEAVRVETEQTTTVEAG